MIDHEFTRRVPSVTEEADATLAKTASKQEIFDIADAIGSKPRWRLLMALSEEPLSIDDLVDQLDLTKGTISVHAKQLEEAGVVSARYTVSDKGGVKKEFAIAVDEITFDFRSL